LILGVAFCVTAGGVFYWMRRSGFGKIRMTRTENLAEVGPVVPPSDDDTARIELVEKDRDVDAEKPSEVEE